MRVYNFLLLLASALQWGCVAYEPRAPVLSVLEVRQHNVVLQNWDISCGAAALATLLNYQHGFPVSEAEITEAMLQRADPDRVKVRGGFSLLDLKQYVQLHNFTAVGYLDLTIDDLEELGPAIVPVHLTQDHHFVVFRGVLDGKVLLADPSFGNAAVDVETFLRWWKQRVGFIVTRQDGRPPPNRLMVLRGDFDAVPDIALRQALR